VTPLPKWMNGISSYSMWWVLIHEDMWRHHGDRNYLESQKPYLAWTKDATRIDELVPEGKKDIHGDCGAYCYEGFRHSLCHGWASGPTARSARG